MVKKNKAERKFDQKKVGDIELNSPRKAEFRRVNQPKFSAFGGRSYKVVAGGLHSHLFFVPYDPFNSPKVLKVP